MSKLLPSFNILWTLPSTWEAHRLFHLTPYVTPTWFLFYATFSSICNLERKALTLLSCTVSYWRVNEVMSGKCFELLREVPKRGGEVPLLHIGSNSRVFRMNWKAENMFKVLFLICTSSVWSLTTCLLWFQEFCDLSSVMTFCILPRTLSTL